MFMTSPPPSEGQVIKISRDSGGACQENRRLRGLVRGADRLRETGRGPSVRSHDDRRARCRRSTRSRPRALVGVAPLRCGLDSGPMRVLAESSAARPHPPADQFRVHLHLVLVTNPLGRRKPLSFCSPMERHTPSRARAGELRPDRPGRHLHSDRTTAVDV